MNLHKVFIDSSVLYAFIDRADPNHSQAVKTMEYFSSQDFTLYTSSQAVQDTYTAVHNQLGSILGYDFLQAIFESSMEVIFPQKTDMISAFKLIKANKSNQIGLREAIISVIMQKKGISRIFTFIHWHKLLGSEPYSASRF